MYIGIFTCVYIYISHIIYAYHISYILHHTFHIIYNPCMTGTALSKGIPILRIFLKNLLYLIYKIDNIYNNPMKMLINPQNVDTYIYIDIIYMVLLHVASTPNIVIE